MSPTRAWPGPRSVKAMTSVGRSCPLKRAFSCRIASRPRKVTDTDAAARSPASTDRTTRRTVRSGSARGRPPTSTSFTRRHLAAGPEDPGGNPGVGILDALMEVSRHHPPELFTHALEVPKREGSFVELPRRDPLGDDVVDRGADRLGCRLRQGAEDRLDRIGEERDGRFPRLGPRPGIAERVELGPGDGPDQVGTVQEVVDLARPMMLRDECTHTLRQARHLGELDPVQDVFADDRG